MHILIVDSSTWVITVLGWVIVFAALMFLVGIFIVIPKIFNLVVKRNLRRKNKDSKGESVKDSNLLITGETNAVIAMSLYMYFNEMHDDESGVITIKQVKKRYSPWSSKLYGMNNYNFRN